MNKKLIINKSRGIATFSDEEKEFSIPILSANVNTDRIDQECEVTLDFMADLVEIR